MAHHAQVVRDEHVGHAHGLLQIGQQVQHLRPDGHVQRRHRLVQHQHPRLQHQGAGDGNALALAAGEHVRIALRMFRAQAHPGQHVAGQGLAFGVAGADAIGRQRLHQRIAHRLARVQ